MLGPDEPRYAAIGQAMAQSGDWVTPRLWGEPWFEKPPFLYWMTAVGFKVGLSEDLAPRLPVALLSVAFLICFFFLLRAEFGERVAAYASAILATCAGWLVYSHIAVTDLPMSAALAIAMLLVMHDPLSRRRAVEAGVFLGIAILAKALVPLALFVPALWFLRRRWREASVVLGVAFVVAAPWYVLMAMRNGAPFWQELFLKHHFARIYSAELQHERPFWFFIPVLIAGMFPWSPLPLLLFSKRLYQDRRAMFLLAWFVFGFVLFSAVRNKLPGYILPLFAPMSVLIAIAIEQASRVKLMWLMASCAGLLVVIPAIQGLLPDALMYGLSKGAEVLIPAEWPIVVILLVVCGFLARTQRVGWAIGVIGVAITLSVVRMIWQVYPVLDEQVSGRVRWQRDANSIVCVEGESRALHYGMNYYARRTIPDCD